MSQSIDSRCPITLQTLINILNALLNVCANTFEERMFASAFSLPYFAILRVSEITQTNCSQNNVLTIHNTLFSSNSIKLILAKTKTDQNVAGTTLIIALSDDNQLLFNNFESYLIARPKYPGQILCHIDCSRLTYYQFNQVLKKALAIINMDTSLWREHYWPTITTDRNVIITPQNPYINDQYLTYMVGYSGTSILATYDI